MLLRLPLELQLLSMPFDLCLLQRDVDSLKESYLGPGQFRAGVKLQAP